MKCHWGRSSAAVHLGPSSGDSRGLAFLPNSAFRLFDVERRQMYVESPKHAERLLYSSQVQDNVS